MVQWIAYSQCVAATWGARVRVLKDSQVGVATAVTVTASRLPGARDMAAPSLFVATMCMPVFLY